jgi:hypothetical protein
MFIFFIYSILKNDFLWSIFTLIMVIICFIPTLIRNFLKIQVPYLFDIFISLAFIFHIGNGLLDINYLYPIYNKFTHFFSAVVVAFIFLNIIFIFNEYYRGIAVNIFKILFDVVVITMAFGVIWEFMEWTGDFLFNLNAQPSLNDTMGDLFADTLGGLFIALIGYFLIKRGIIKNFSKDFKKHFNDIIEKK